MIREQVWTLIDEGGGNVVEFTSFIDIDTRNEGQALSYPVEEGGFANYNKVQTPLDLRVTLATQGAEADFESILNRLDEYQAEARKLFVSTPAAFYGPMTLESYSNRRTTQSGAGLLTVELALVEVREVQTQTTTTVITKPKNPTSASTTNTGKTQPDAEGDKPKSVLNTVFGSGKG